MTQPTYYNAWHLAGSWWWVEEGYGCRIKGGRTIYESATALGNGRVRLERLDVQPADRSENWRAGVKQVNRYVNDDTEMELVKY